MAGAVIESYRFIVEVLASARRIAAVRVALREPRTTGERIRSCPPPELTLGLLLNLADSLTRHPRLAVTEVFIQAHSQRSL